MAKTFNISPRGPFLHPWINRPDTKYNEDGLFHVDQVVSGEPGRKLADRIKAAAEKALAEHVDEMKPAEAKKWSLYLSDEELEDDDGNSTGDIKFAFKQNRVIPLKDGGTKTVDIEIRDAKDNIVDAKVFGGTEGRIMFSMRPIVMQQAKEVGVRLDFFKVQVIKMAERKGAGFGAVDDDDADDLSSQAGFGDGADDEQGGEY
jgi:hypothetical protein